MKVLDRVSDAIRQRTMNELERAEVQAKRDVETLVELAREVAPYIALADIDWKDRPRRVSAESLVALFKKRASPADDLGKLHTAIKSYPHQFTWSARALDRFIHLILDPARLGHRINPWPDHGAILR